MIPRKQIDIGWGDLAAGALRCGWPGSAAALRDRIERLWDPWGGAVATLSVRSGLDLLLRALAFPAGSQVLVSAVTIRDMVRILESHGLEPVPVDLDMERLEVAAESLEAAVTPRTRALLVAHLFGSRMPMSPLVAFARERGLFLMEDCAQAWDGTRYRGDPGVDVSMFSFGPIKTGTALGGGILRFREPALAKEVRGLQEALPPQRRRSFLGRVLKYAGIRAVLTRPGFTVFAGLCRALGRTHDEVISGAVRGFPGGDLLAAIRHRPSYPLLALLHRRIRRFDPREVRDRARLGREIRDLVPGLEAPGRGAATHTHWVVPVLVSDPDRTCRELWRRGMDATRGASSLFAVAPGPGAPGRSPVRVASVMDRLIYLPAHPGMGTRDLVRLREALEEALGLDAETGSRSPETAAPSTMSPAAP